MKPNVPDLAALNWHSEPHWRRAIHSILIVHGIEFLGHLTRLAKQVRCKPEYTIARVKPALQRIANRFLESSML
ncbi:MAG: hypothetical protein CBE00_13895 [Planctomycetaceae bacterium TMED240]|nr:hypothetical protein [Rhodopirellula sp.]OUX03641.1 MAG: hypothetical protein CBE00_13895 [Planctomycetaceae bacterium TMED240]